MTDTDQTPSPRLKEVIGPEAIARRVAELGADISRHYARTRGEVVLAPVLKGAVVFFADLLRHLDFSPLVDFIRVASYGEGTSPGEVIHFTKDLELSIAGRQVLLIDDIVDTGRSMAFLKSVLLAREPADIRVCALIDKRQRREVDLVVDFAGFVVDRGYLVGYGLDHAERLRELKGICELIE